MNSAQLKELGPVLEAIYQKAQARLHNITQQEKRLNQQLQDLQDARASSLLRDGSDPATIAGANVRWQRWIDQRRKEINLELAQLAAQRLGARADLKKAFGRKDVFEVLLSQQISAEKKQAKRRQDQLS